MEGHVHSGDGKKVGVGVTESWKYEGGCAIE